jgi:hypothetical protein
VTVSKRLATRLEAFEESYSHGRLIRLRNAFHETSDDGIQRSSLLGAFGSDVTSIVKVPAYLMPDWMAHLLDRIDRRTSQSDWQRVTADIVKLVPQWHILKPYQWQLVQSSILLDCMHAVSSIDSTTYADQVAEYHARRLKGDEPKIEDWRSLRKKLSDASRTSYLRHKNSQMTVWPLHSALTAAKDAAGESISALDNAVIAVESFNDANDRMSPKNANGIETVMWNRFANVTVLAVETQLRQA